MRALSASVSNSGPNGSNAARAISSQKKRPESVGTDPKDGVSGRLAAQQAAELASQLVENCKIISIARIQLSIVGD